jgi:hypothetical protein
LIFFSNFEALNDLISKSLDIYLAVKIRFSVKKAAGLVVLGAGFFHDLPEPLQQLLRHECSGLFK